MLHVKWRADHREIEAGPWKNNQKKADGENCLDFQLECITPFKINSNKTRKQRKHQPMTDFVRNKYIDWHVRSFFSPLQDASLSACKSQGCSEFVCRSPTKHISVTVWEGERAPAHKLFLQPVQKHLELSCKVSFYDIFAYSIWSETCFSSFFFLNRPIIQKS